MDTGVTVSDCYDPLQLPGIFHRNYRRLTLATRLARNRVKKRQQRVTMIMDSKHIEYTVIDITEPGKESEKDFMQTNAQHKGCTISDPNPRHALPPQLFNDTEYCGDYDDFDLANEVDNLEVFLKLAAPAPEAPAEHKNGTDAAVAATAEDADDENKENKTEDNGAAAAEEEAGGDAAAEGANEV
uniref:SH3 domain-binding glutamic acid-rich-like protein n=1 Tax=Anopheles farauti TaxID=69004 RepID=A0A182QKW9_9DIPT